MFERTFSFWRSLVGRREAPAPVNRGGAAVEEDRRLWVRFQADVETRVQLAQGDDAERVSARVRDVSAGGANLVAGRAFQPGQILSLELPGAVGDALQIVLACVVRVARQADGEWSVGCVFSRELSHEDLERFGARKTKPADDDQRTWVRYECAVTATYQRVGDTDGETYTAQVLNLSASGVGLLLIDEIEPGSLINLTLQGKQGHAVRTILACIVHSTRRAGGELAIGCNFIRELGEDELKALL